MSWYGQTLGTIADCASAGQAGGFVRGLVDGDEGVADRDAEKKAQYEATGKALEATGMKDIYEGAKDLPGVGEFVGLPESATKISDGTMKTGRAIHEGYAGICDWMTE